MQIRDVFVVGVVAAATVASLTIVSAWNSPRSVEPEPVEVETPVVRPPSSDDDEPEPELVELPREPSEEVHGPLISPVIKSEEPERTPEREREPTSLKGRRAGSIREYIYESFPHLASEITIHRPSIDMRYDPIISPAHLRGYHPFSSRSPSDGSVRSKLSGESRRSSGRSTDPYGSRAPSMSDSYDGSSSSCVSSQRPSIISSSMGYPVPPSPAAVVRFDMKPLAPAPAFLAPAPPLHGYKMVPEAREQPEPPISVPATSALVLTTPLPPSSSTPRTATTSPPVPTPSPKVEEQMPHECPNPSPSPSDASATPSLHPWLPSDASGPLLGLPLEPIAPSPHGVEAVPDPGPYPTFTAGPAVWGMARPIVLAECLPRSVSPPLPPPLIPPQAEYFSFMTTPDPTPSTAASSPPSSQGSLLTRLEKVGGRVNEAWYPAAAASPRLDITTRPRRPLIDLDASVVLRISAAWQMKSLAGALAGRMRKGEEVVLVPEQGLEHLNHCIKSLCVARTFIKPNTVDLFVHVEWSDEAGLSLLCQSRPWAQERQPFSEDIKVRIAGKSAPPPVQTAGLIANRLREHQICFILVMGAEAVLQSMRALCLAHNFVNKTGAIWFQPKFITIERSVSNRSAIQMTVLQDD
eukprot:EG_transcript_1964